MFFLLHSISEKRQGLECKRWSSLYHVHLDCYWYVIFFRLSLFEFRFLFYIRLFADHDFLLPFSVYHLLTTTKLHLFAKCFYLHLKKKREKQNRYVSTNVNGVEGRRRRRLFFSFLNELCLFGVLTLCNVHEWILRRVLDWLTFRITDAYRYVYRSLPQTNIEWRDTQDK